MAPDGIFSVSLLIRVFKILRSYRNRLSQFILLIGFLPQGQIFVNIIFATLRISDTQVIYYKEQSFADVLQNSCS